jgi:hypothetical protein
MLLGLVDYGLAATVRKCEWVRNIQRVALTLTCGFGFALSSRPVCLQATAPPLSLTSSYSEGLRLPNAECLAKVVERLDLYSKIAVRAI